MKPELLSLFTESIQREAAERFALDTNHIRPLEGFENVVCECTRNGEPYVLRISHDGRRSQSMIEAELHWIDYLAAHGVSVCTPFRSREGRLVEIFDLDDCQWFAAVFEKAKGPIVRRNDQTPGMAVNRGRLLGRIHALSKCYQPSSQTIRRPQWYEADDFVNFARHLTPTDALVVRRFHELMNKLRSFPQDNDNSGLIHFDAHTGNMFFDGETPTLFDFDDCAYDFFVSDIALALFYMILFLPDKWQPAQFARDFLIDVLKGYRETCPIDSRMFELIPLKLKRREIVLYIAIHRGMDLNNLDDWSTRYLDGRRERIENEVPVLDFDWAGLS